jgi:hypothetical protein
VDELRVAIASEFDLFDGEAYRVLLELVLGVPVRRWAGDFRFFGDKHVAKMAPSFLGAAERAGVGRALLAVDNDGGASRRPEHDATHTPIPDGEFDIEDDVSCRECWLEAAIPPAWRSPARSCVVVPVQMLETWLLALRGDPLEPTPEQANAYSRDVLKRRFFGRPQPPVERRIELARVELSRPDALDVLRERPSFRRFEARLSHWR